MKSDVSLTGRRILLVEDEYLIGFDVRNKLADSGALVFGPVGDLDLAFAFLHAEPWLDVAILDLNVRGELSFPLADELVRQNVPFVFTTGYGTEVIPYRFQHIICCEKPVRTGDIVDVVTLLIYELGTKASDPGLSEANPGLVHGIKITQDAE